MTFDGCAVNRRLLQLHDTANKSIYKVLNVHAKEERYVCFFSDPPHLMKTIRNCWASKNRTLWVCIHMLILLILIFLTE